MSDFIQIEGPRLRCDLAMEHDLEEEVAELRAQRAEAVRDLKAQDVMHPGPRTIRQDALAVEAAELMEAHRITSVLVVDEEGELCGALNSNDLMRAKVI